MADEKMLECYCGKPAELIWEVTGEVGWYQKPINVCSACLSRMWPTICTKYPNSNAQQSSVFTAINQ
jgi:hypothetical protein